MCMQALWITLSESIVSLARATCTICRRLARDRSLQEPVRDRCHKGSYGAHQTNRSKRTCGIRLWLDLECLVWHISRSTASTTTSTTGQSRYRGPISNGVCRLPAATRLSNQALHRCQQQVDLRAARCHYWHDERGSDSGVRIISQSASRTSWRQHQQWRQHQSANRFWWGFHDIDIDWFDRCISLIYCHRTGRFIDPYRQPATSRRQTSTRGRQQWRQRHRQSGSHWWRQWCSIDDSAVQQHRERWLAVHQTTASILGRINRGLVLDQHHVSEILRCISSWCTSQQQQSSPMPFDGSMAMAAIHLLPRTHAHHARHHLLERLYHWPSPIAISIMKSTSLYERRVKLAVEPHVQYGEPPRSRSIVSHSRTHISSSSMDDATGPATPRNNSFYWYERHVRLTNRALCHSRISVLGRSVGHRSLLDEDTLLRWRSSRQESVSSPRSKARAHTAAV